MHSNLDILAFLSQQLQTFRELAKCCLNAPRPNFDSLQAECVIGMGVNIAQLIDRVDVSMSDRLEEGSEEWKLATAKVTRLHFEWHTVAEELRSLLSTSNKFPSLPRGLDTFLRIQTEIRIILNEEDDDAFILRVA